MDIQPPNIATNTTEGTFPAPPVGPVLSCIVSPYGSIQVFSGCNTVDTSYVSKIQPLPAGPDPFKDYSWD